MKNIRKPQVAKHQPRVEGEPFDPSRVCPTMNVVVAKMVTSEAARINEKMGR